MRHIRTVPIRYPRRARGGGWIVISTMWLEEQAAHDLEAARNACLTRYGNHLLITDMGRTPAQQHRRFTSRSRAAPPARGIAGTKRGWQWMWTWRI